MSSVLNGLATILVLLSLPLGAYGLLMAQQALDDLRHLPAGTQRMNETAAQLRKCAEAFLRERFDYLKFVIGIAAVIILFAVGFYAALQFLLGALFCGGTVVFAVVAAGEANLRTIAAAADRGPAGGLAAAISGGAVMGLAVSGFLLLGFGLMFFFLGSPPAFALGASLVAVFARFRNYFPFAAGSERGENNFSDIAALSSELFALCSAGIVATFMIAGGLPIAELKWVTTYREGLNTDSFRYSLAAAPVMYFALGLLASIAGMRSLKKIADGAQSDPGTALVQAKTRAIWIFLTLAFVVTEFMTTLRVTVWLAAFFGAGGAILNGRWQSRDGRANPFFRGAGQALLAAGMLSAAGYIAGAYGIGIAAVAMLATGGIASAIDAISPIARSAAAIAGSDDSNHELASAVGSIEAAGKAGAALSRELLIFATTLTGLGLFAAFVLVSPVEAAFSLNLPQALSGILFAVFAVFTVSFNGNLNLPGTEGKSEFFAIYLAGILLLAMLNCGWAFACGFVAGAVVTGSALAMLAVRDCAEVDPERNYSAASCCVFIVLVGLLALVFVRTL